MTQDLLSAFLILCIAGIVADTVVKIVKARAGGGKKLEAQLHKLEAQLADQGSALDAAHQGLADQAAQMQELHDRLDFAERLLTQARERQGLGPGAQG